MSIYFGVVEDRSGDVFKACRYKVRVLGVHSPLTSELPTSDLPWSTPVQNNSAAMSGIGHSATGYLQGSTVAVVFLDADLQIPLILGAIAGVPGITDYTGSELFNSLQADLSIIPPDQPSTEMIKDANGALIEPGYIGTLTSSDIKILISKIGTLRGSDYSAATLLGLGKYQLTNTNLIKLGYKDEALLWTGLNNILDQVKFLNDSAVQDNAIEELLKLNFVGLNMLSVASTSTPREKLAGLLVASMVDDVKGAYTLLDTGVDTVNVINESVLKFYREGYTLIAGKTTNEIPTKNNINDESSDKYDINTDTSKSKYDVKQVEKIDKNQGFKDPSGKYPLNIQKNESDISRLATGIKINETIVGAKETNLVKSVPIANSTVTWKQSPIPYNALYPYNNVYQSESGHVMEFDDTPGSERINIHHKSGTFHEIDNAGNSVEKNVGIRQIIVEKDELVYIKGSGHVTIDGDMSLKVNKALNIEVTGDVNLKVNGNFTNEVTGGYSVLAGGPITFFGATFAMQSIPALPVIPSFPTIEIPSPVTRKEVQAMELEDTSATTILANSKNHPEPSINKSDAAQPINTIPIVKEINALPEEITYQTRLSSNFTIRDLCVGSLGSNYPFKGQHGLTSKQLAENLKYLCLNVIEPMKEMFADKGLKLNSVIRPAGNPRSLAGKISQHELGQAADISFTKVRGSSTDRTQFYDIAIWVRDNILFDQLLLEYRDEGRQVWLHISFNNAGNRRQVLTLNNDIVISQGLAVLG